MMKTISIKEDNEYRHQRAEDIAREIATLTGLPYSEQLLAFYTAAYNTAVYDISDDGVPYDQRQGVINEFALSEVGDKP